MLTTMPLSGQSNQLENIVEIEAAYIRHLMEYTRWPESAGTNNRPLVLGVVGKDTAGLGGVLEYGISEVALKIKGRPFQLKKFANAKAAGVAGCDALFFLKSEQGLVDDLIKSLKGKPILLISNISGFASKGGMTGLAMSDGPKVHIIIEVNRNALKESKMDLSAKLLGLKKGVRIIKE
ncbi:MAG: YfiR family protein [Opitutae bacterium]|nr:YfiR family protein [Opitutae bacterium]MBT6461434.1 YfiR family protein [Opitutae bacterium]